MTRIAAAALLAAFLLAVCAGVSKGEGEETPSFKWRLNDGDLFVYSITQFYKDQKTGEKRKSTTSQKHMMFSYEMDEQGRPVNPDESSISPHTLPLNVVFSVPPSIAVNGRAAVTYDMTGSPSYKPIALNGFLTYLGKEEFEKKVPIVEEEGEKEKEEEEKFRTITVEYDRFHGKLEISPSKKPPTNGTPSIRITGGAIEYDTYFDAREGCVARTYFSCKYSYVSGDKTYDQEAERELELIERYNSNAKDLQRRVRKAVQAGIEYIEGEQKDAGYYHTEPREGQAVNQHTMGETGLAVTALCLSGVPKEDKGVKKALDYLRTLPFSGTYDMGCMIMAIEAYHTPLYEISRSERQLEEGKSFKPRPRKLPKEDYAWMARAVKWLLNNGSQNESGAWHYARNGPDPGYDNSNSQYAVLALLSADRCRIPVETSVWREMLFHWLGDQQSTGPKFAFGREKGGSFVPTQARGWCYGAPSQSPKGSMTCAGIASTQVAADVLLNRGAVKSASWNKAQAAVNSGLAWLAMNYSLTRNPGGGMGWYYYYLYGVERAGVFTKTRHFNGHDWYREGAAILVSTVQEGRAWGSVQNTAFALLFLKKATVPVSR